MFAEIAALIMLGGNVDACHTFTNVKISGFVLKQYFQFYD